MRASVGPDGLLDPSSVVDGDRYTAEVPDTLDLADRARIVLNVLTRNPDPGNHFRVWQAMDFGARPPYMRRGSFTTQPQTMKFAEALPMMRIMSGSDFNLQVERDLMGTLVAHIGRHGLCYGPPTGLVPEYPDGLAGAYENGRMMLAMLAWYQRDQDPTWRTLLRNMAEGLGQIAIERGDYAYHPIESGYRDDLGWRWTRFDRLLGTGNEPYFSYYPPEEPSREQQGLEGTVKHRTGACVRALSLWYGLSGDESALELAGGLTRFLLKPGLWEAGKPGDLVGPEHGIFEGHTHGNLNGLRAILGYAIATGDKRLKQLVRDGYVYARNFGISRLGWFPGWINPQSYGRPGVHTGVCESCAVADMMALAIRLSDAGVEDCWEDVDQYARNQLVEQQVMRRDLMERVSAASPERTVQPSWETDDRVIDRSVGGFVGFGGVTHAHNAAHGCCTGNGAQALYYVWESIVRYCGGVAQVNLLLNRVSPWLDVISYLPYEGKVVLRNKEAQHISVRIPYWADQANVKCELNGAEATPSWHGNYLLFRGLSGGDVLTVEFPMAETTETYRVGDSKYTCRFKGNTLIDISPRDDRPTVYPTYLRDHYKRDKAPVRTVGCYVSPSIISW